MEREKEIYYAITYNRFDDLKKLISKENVNHKVKDGYPIHYAVFKNNLIITKYLIELGADVNVRFEDESTPLITAAENGFQELCELLLEHGAQANAVDNYGNDALVKAVFYGRTELIKLLIKYGADANNSKVRGKTAIDLAKEMKLPEIISLLTNNKV